MELFHGSNEEITSITENGFFGGLFASGNEQSAKSHGEVLHKITSMRPLSNYKLNYEIESAFDVAMQIARGDELVAEAIMSPGCEALEDCSDATEQGLEFQQMRGELARRLGFTSVEMLDEHGTTWLCLPGCEIEVIK